MLTVTKTTKTLYVKGFPLDVIFREDRDGVQYLFKFENGYGASVVKDQYSYGYDHDLWELALIKFDDEESWELVYMGDYYDVVRWLTDKQVEKHLKKIKKMKKE